MQFLFFWPLSDNNIKFQKLWVFFCLFFFKKACLVMTACDLTQSLYLLCLWRHLLNESFIVTRVVNLHISQQLGLSRKGPVMIHLHLEWMQHQVLFTLEYFYALVWMHINRQYWNVETDLSVSLFSLQWECCSAVLWTWNHSELQVSEHNNFFFNSRTQMQARMRQQKGKIKNKPKPNPYQFTRHFYICKRLFYTLFLLHRQDSFRLNQDSVMCPTLSWSQSKPRLQPFSRTMSKLVRSMRPEWPVLLQYFNNQSEPVQTSHGSTPATFPTLLLTTTEYISLHHRRPLPLYKHPKASPMSYIFYAIVLMSASVLLHQKTTSEN